MFKTKFMFKTRFMLKTKLMTAPTFPTRCLHLTNSLQRPKSLHLITLLLASSVLGLNGCQKTLQAPALTTPLPTQEVVKTQFSIAGKIGIKTPQQNGSAFYAWTQVNQYFAIDLTGALGIGQTRIEGIPGKVSLTSAKTGRLQAATPEELLQQATGWQAPISYLVSWVQGKPASNNAQATYDEQQRLKQLAEGGWQVQFSYDHRAVLPQKLVMVQAQGENRVTLTIQSREEAARQ